MSSIWWIAPGYTFATGAVSRASSAKKESAALPSVGRCRKSTRRPDAATIALSTMTAPLRSVGWRDGQPLRVPKQP